MVICHSAKPKARKGKILLINAVNEVTRERAQSFLTREHIERIVQAYAQFKTTAGFTRVATREEVRAKEGNLSLPLYVAPTIVEAKPNGQAAQPALPTALGDWLHSAAGVRAALDRLLKNAR